MRQLLTPESQYFEHLKATRQRGSPPVDVLLATLKAIASSYTQVYIILDGLDECLNRDPLLETLSTLETDKLNVLVTSRTEKDIEESFEGKARVGFDQKSVQYDIQTHIGWMLENRKKLKNIKPELKETIRSRLAEKSAGM
jgi:hypothetical protein